ncbi:NUDIX hydrolase [Microbacterium sp. NPDC090225]|uniref:NUDIX hydrolase n=1 Tax=Microbacterium sp. NPDC090225 TaxID=3364207 RepID=UPI0037F87AB9
MDAEHETVVRVTADAPWLPPGGRAEVVRRDSPPRPMSMVRLLLRRGDEVYCVPRSETGKLDLPTRSTDGDDLDGSVTIRALAAEVVGAPTETRFLGAVRNVVERPGSDYPWPTPLAHFGVWASPDAPIIDGTWADLSTLTERHWHPLVV